MKLQIGHKLFLVIFLANLIVSTAILGSIGWSFSSSFREYLHQDTVDSIEPLLDGLAEEYHRHGDNWDWLERNRHIWQQTLRRYLNPQLETDEGTNHRPRRPRDSQVYDDGPRNSDAQIPRPRRAHDRDPPMQDRFLRRVGPMIVRDQNQTLIIGSNALLKEEYSWLPILFEEKKIGELGIQKNTAVESEVDRLFIKRLLIKSTWAVFIVLLISGVLAILYSRRMVRPIVTLQNAMHKLSTGNIQTVELLHVSGGDELAKLALSFNRLAETLNQNIKARKQWVADISHELRTPIAVLRGELEALLEGIRPLEKTAIQSLHEEVMRLSRLIGDLYELSLSDLGALDYRFENISAREFVNQLVTQAEQEAEKHGLNFKVQIHVQNEELHGDWDRLMQLFRNLLSNSLRYTSRGGSLHVRCEIDALKESNASKKNNVDKMIIIRWEDSKPGVTDEDLPRLFDRLYRTGDARDRVSGGSGLGMAICRVIVEAHQGSIAAEHSQLGGVAIVIALPCK